MELAFHEGRAVIPWLGGAKGDDGVPVGQAHTAAVGRTVVRLDPRDSPGAEETQDRIGVEGPSCRQAARSSTTTRVCLRLATTKTGKNQWAELHNQDVGRLLARHVESRSSFDHVFLFPARHRTSHYRRLFKSACIALHLHTVGFTPHSLRHGGATHAHMNLNQSIEDIMHRGRWLSNNTCRKYIQSGNAALLVQKIPPSAFSLSSN